mgnify:FL=1|jgi:site-specific DNA-methyltransferase (adenine-specific)
MSASVVFECSVATLWLGDCLEVMRLLPDNSVDSVVTDPPYGLSFMGKRWDYDVPKEDVWRECLRVLKPGGHLLAFAGTRTQHRMCVRIEDAGFEIRDMIAWVYGSGFPKSHDVSKAIDREAGQKRGRTTVRSKSVSTCYAQDEWTRLNAGTVLDSRPITQGASEWVGWGTALKPALEPITVARKPLDGTVAANVLKWGCGGMNVEGCRVPSNGDKLGGGSCCGSESTSEAWDRPWKHSPEALRKSAARQVENVARAETLGRWPANLIHDGSDEVQALTGSAARFFYCAKASKADRDEGCEGLEARQYSHDGRDVPIENAYQRNQSKARNHHPTVKPTDLMRYLCRLVTPTGGVVLDPFTGSGSTGKAAALEGFRFIGAELEAEYADIAARRIAFATRKCGDLLFGGST